MGGAWAFPLPPYFSQYLHPVGFFSFSFFSFFLVFVLSLDVLRRLLLLLARGYGEREVDGDGDGERRLGCLLVVRSRPLFVSSPPVLELAACALSISNSLEYGLLSLMDVGGVCTNCVSLSIPWLAMSTIYPGAFAFLRSHSSSATAIALLISLSKVAVWVWLYLYCLFILR